MNTFEAAGAAGRADALHHLLLELATAHNENTNAGTCTPATYLRVTVRL